MEAISNQQSAIITNALSLFVSLYHRPTVNCRKYLGVGRPPVLGRAINGLVNGVHRSRLFSLARAELSLWLFGPAKDADSPPLE